MDTIFRYADAGDAEQIASLHADSWRRTYRGAYADTYLDGDVFADRFALWSARLNGADRATAATIVGVRENGVDGFVHVVFDEDAQWGSLVDNLHVTFDRKRSGIGTRLLSLGAAEVVRRGSGNAVHLWVQQLNTAAQAFYRARGGECVETTFSEAPSGNSEWLMGTPRKHRMFWPDAASL